MVEVVDHYAREMQRYADVTVVVPEVPGEPFDDSQFGFIVKTLHDVPVTVYCPSVRNRFVDPL